MNSRSWRSTKLKYIWASSMGEYRVSNDAAAYAPMKSNNKKWMNTKNGVIKRCVNYEEQEVYGEL